MRLEEAIKQREFANPYHKAHVNILYTAASVSQYASAKMKPFGISTQQFNILRILKGRKGEASTVKLLTERMIDKMSNASRLVDKLVNKELVERRVCKTDRRRVDVFITPKGLDLINKVSVAVEEEIHAQLSQRVTAEEVAELNRILDKIHS